MCEALTSVVRLHIWRWVRPTDSEKQPAEQQPKYYGMGVGETDENTIKDKTQGRWNEHIVGSTQHTTDSSFNPTIRFHLPSRRFSDAEVVTH